MYEFYFGELDEILENEEKYLLFVKRLLPRWANGIPDSEFLAIYNIVKDIDFTNKKPVFVETGSGASSLVLFYFAAKMGGKLYSWDTNGSKAAFLRSVVNDNLCKALGVNLHKHWKFVEFLSTDPHLGIPILHELNEKVDFCFLDSWHTLDNLGKEVELLIPLLSDTAFVALDDANYNNISYNYGFVNMFRKKLGLAPVEEPEENKGEPYFVAIEKMLKESINSVEKVDDTYKKTYSEDIFFSYYNIDKEVMGKMGMEKNDERDHRFDAWKIEK